MTTAGLVSTPREATAPTRLTRVAAVASLLLGLALAAALPAVTEAAFYVGLLAGASAAVAAVAGLLLWSHATMLVRAVAALGAGATILGQLLQLVEGLPGARELGRIGPSSSGIAFVLATVVVVSLLLDARARGRDLPPEHPYAL
jgi:hypothetical protein